MNTRFGKKGIWIAIIMVVALVAATVLLIARQGTPNRRIVITNLNSCAPNINKLIASQVSTNAYAFVERANKYNNHQNLPSYTAEIRNGTCHTITKNNSTGISRTTAVLDVPEAKQSWKVTFSWTAEPGTPQIDIGTIEPTCLPSSQLRYGEFKCINVLSLINYGTDKYDPILQYVPYSGDSFSLSYSPDTKTISATVNVPPDEANNTALISNTEATIPLWLQENGLNPNDYTIRYRVVAVQD